MRGATGGLSRPGLSVGAMQQYGQHANHHTLSKPFGYCRLVNIEFCGGTCFQVGKRQEVDRSPKERASHNGRDARNVETSQRDTQTAA